MKIGAGPKSVKAHVLPCGHELHHQCSYAWFQLNPSCPICRKEITHGSIHFPILVADIIDPTLVEMFLILHLLQELSRQNEGNILFKRRLNRQLKDMWIRYQREIQDFNETSENDIVTPQRFAHWVTHEEVSEFEAQYLNNPDALFLRIAKIQTNGLFFRVECLVFFNLNMID